MKKDHRNLAATCLAALGVMLGSCQAMGQQIDNENYLTNVDVVVLPFANLQVQSPALLYLQVPPATSTVPSSGVNFTVTGNSLATVTAEPTSFVVVPSDDYPLGEYMGRAELAGNPVGYRLQVHFPVTGAPNSPVQIAGLPGYEAGPTHPLTVNLLSTVGTRNGRIHMAANHLWTPSGGIPLPGLYEGEVILTVTAN